MKAIPNYPLAKALTPDVLLFGVQGNGVKQIPIEWLKKLADLGLTYDEDGKRLVITHADGTIEYVPLSDLIEGLYAKPISGIPKTDLAAAVQASLEKADSALQSYIETDPTVPAWAKAESKPSYTPAEIGAATAAQGAKADSALQSFTEVDPTVPAWAKESTKPTYTASEVGAVDLVNNQTILGTKTFKAPANFYVPTANADGTVIRMGDRDSTYGFELKYRGSPGGNNNEFEMYADNQTGTPVKSYGIKQDGVLDFKVQPTVNGSAILKATDLTPITEIEISALFA